MDTGLGGNPSKNNKNLGGKEKMKRKNKTLAFWEIVVVLCSVFLVATLPCIAADQTTQKVSATTTSEDDFTLDIYGNANEDDTIDIQDVTYIKRIIFGEEDKTELADANYDGKISGLDVVQTKLIILGKEGKLTFIDSHEGYPRNVVTVDKPVERIIPFADNQADGIKVLGAVDKVLGVGTEIKDKPILYPVMSELPDVGGVWGAGPDIEAIISLNPDILLTYEFRPSPEALDEKLEGTGIKVVRLTFDIDMPQFKIMGYVLDKEDEAEEFIDFFDSHMGLIKERTEGLSEDEKPQVFIEWCQPYLAFNKLSGAGQLCEMAGGINIAADLTGVGSPHSLVVEPEWVAAEDPDIIIKIPSRGTGYDVDDVAGIKAARDDIMNRDGWSGMKAVETGNVSLLSIELHDGPHAVVAAQYYATWFHPELFPDLDPQAFHQEYLDKFMGIDYDVKEHGIFVYHPERYPNGR
jgi:iron complex transport system substrate-binding protein